MLIPARKWIRATFVPDGRPTLRQVEQWISDGEIPGMKIGKDLYVDDSFATAGKSAVQTPQPEETNVVSIPEKKLKKNLLRH